MTRNQRIDWHQVFQQAALDPTTWMQALDLLADATGSTSGQLIGVGGAKTVPFNWVTSFSPEAVKRFEAIDGGSPQVNFRIAADIGVQTATIIDERDYDRVRPLLASDAYLDLCSDYDIPFGCQTALRRDDGGLIGLAVLRRTADGRTNERQRGEFARAATAARAAVKLQAAIEHQGMALLAGTFDALALECFLIDRHGRVADMTAEAATRIADATVIRISDGQLGSAVPVVARNIHRALARVFTGSPNASVCLTSGIGPTLDLFAIRPQPWSLGFQPRVIAVVRDPARRLEVARDTIAGGLGLSVAETDIAILLAQGHARDAVASRRGVTMATLRTQIRSLYEKTGCTREAELVALVHRCAG